MFFIDDAGDDLLLQQRIIDDFIPVSCLGKLIIMNNTLLEAAVAALVLTVDDWFMLVQ